MQSLVVTENSSEPCLEDMLICLDNLVIFYESQGRYADAGLLYQRAITMTEKALGDEHPSLVIMLEGFAAILKTLGNEGQAEDLERRAAKIKDRSSKPASTKNR